MPRKVDLVDGQFICPGCGAVNLVGADALAGDRIECPACGEENEIEVVDAGDSEN